MSDNAKNKGNDSLVNFMLEEVKPEVKRTLRKEVDKEVSEGLIGDGFLDDLDLNTNPLLDLELNLGEDFTDDESTGLESVNNELTEELDLEIDLGDELAGLSDNSISDDDFGSPVKDTESWEPFYERKMENLNAKNIYTDIQDTDSCEYPFLVVGTLTEDFELLYFNEKLIEGEDLQLWVKTGALGTVFLKKIKLCLENFLTIWKLYDYDISLVNKNDSNEIISSEFDLDILNTILFT